MLNQKKKAKSSDLPDIKRFRALPNQQSQSSKRRHLQCIQALKKSRSESQVYQKWLSVNLLSPRNRVSLFTLQAVTV